MNSKLKSGLTAALFAIMLGLIDAGLFKLWPFGFWIITGALATLGLVMLAFGFYAFLCPAETKELTPPSLPKPKPAVKQELAEPRVEDDVKVYSYEQVKEDVMGFENETAVCE